MEVIKIVGISIFAVIMIIILKTIDLKWHWFFQLLQV